MTSFFSSEQGFAIRIALSLILSLFVVWKEGRKDGFSQERLFDNYLLTLLVASLFSRIFYGLQSRFLFPVLVKHVFYFWTPGFSPEGFIVGFIVGAIGLSFLYKWSIYRILDIYSLALSLGGAFIILALLEQVKFTSPLLLVAALLGFYFVFSYLRLRRIFSGLIFALFLILIVLLLNLFPESQNRGLLFNLGLVTIGTIILISRIKRISYMKRNLPAEFIHKLKGLLIQKDKRLEKQQKLLDLEDPYMQPGRADDNANDIDEAHLEDNLKVVSEANKDVVEKMSKSVKKALKKIDRGDYGVCERCGSPIDSARLEAYPEATLCSDCARKTE